MSCHKQGLAEEGPPLLNNFCSIAPLLLCAVVRVGYRWPDGIGIGVILGNAIDASEPWVARNFPRPRLYCAPFRPPEEHRQQLELQKRG
jgi:hypothetical protein